MDRKALVTLAGVMATLGLALPGGAAAETQITGIAGGASFSTPLAEEHQVYEESTGFRGQFWAKNEAVLGQSLQLHGSVGYRPYNIRGLTHPYNIKLQQWAFLVGLETVRNPSGWIKSFFGVDVGAVFSQLQVPANYTKSSAFHFATEVVSGVEIPIIGGLSLQASTPLTFIFSRNQFMSLSAEASLRWTL